MGKGDGALDSCGPNVSEMDAAEIENGDHEANAVEVEAASGTDVTSSSASRGQDVMDVIDSVNDAAIEEIRRQIRVEDQPFPKPKKMPLNHYQELCRALEVEKFLAPFIKSAQAPWTDLEIIQLIRARDRTFCLWAPKKHLPILQKVVKLALTRIVADQELVSYEMRVSFEEMDTSMRLQRQAGGYSMVSSNMTCEYDVPGANHAIGHERKTATTVCAFLQGNSQYYFLGTSHLTNLEGRLVYFRNEAQHAERKPLGRILHHARSPKPFIEAFLGKLDNSRVQVGGGLVNLDKIHEGSIWELLGETVYMPLEGGRKICEGKVEYLGVNKHCEDPDTGEVIDGSSLLYCRPMHCDNLSPPGSSGTGVFVREEEVAQAHGGEVQNILAAMNLFRLQKDNQEWAVCQHIVVPMAYFRETLGCSSLTLYNGEDGRAALARRHGASGQTEGRHVDGEVKARASHTTSHAQHVELRVPWSVSHGAGIRKPTDDPYEADDFSYMRAG